MKVKLGVSLFLAFAVFLFISQNTDMVMIDFLVWSAEISLVTLVFIVLGTGIIIGWLMNSYLRFTRNRRLTKSQGNKQVNAAVAKGVAAVNAQGEKKAQ
jgi:uncharacterized membrane protein YciS (DUF1049 family)